MNKPVVLMGGGMDSYAVLLYLKSTGIKDVVGLHVDYGQVGMEAERAAVIKQCEFAGYEYIIDYDEGKLIHGNNPNGSLLFGDKTAPPMMYARNLVLLLIATQYGDNIYLGLDKPYDGGIPYFDCTLDYFQQAIKLIGNPNLTVAAPFVEADKADVCKAALQVDPNFFDNFMSCWIPVNNEECGECKHCKTKAELRSKAMGIQAYKVVCDETNESEND